jgi:16S rRNA (uracil1498-N3)-methyltransferase
MTLPHFLVPQPAREGSDVELDPAEAKHARVRRIRRGEEIVVLDGRGWSAFAVVDTVGARALRVRIVRERPERHGESSLDLTLAVALLKSDRFDWLIEKATELGVTRMRPFASRFSLARPSAARRERWRQIALAATKQCGRSVPPEVHPPVAFDAVLRQIGGTKYLFTEGTEIARRQPDEPIPPQSVSILIGPEGGFTDEECSAAEAAGCRRISLGPRTLRAETAALAAVTLCQLVFGDLDPRRR